MKQTHKKKHNNGNNINTTNKININTKTPKITTTKVKWKQPK